MEGYSVDVLELLIGAENLSDVLKWFKEGQYLLLNR
jgi:hypothetical protein